MQIIKCPNCGYEFPSPIQMANATNVTYSGNKTHCPNCTKEVLVAPNGRDGVYSFDRKGIATLLSGPQFTPDILSRLRVAAESAKATPEKVDDFIKQANAIAPSLGDKFAVYLSDPANIVTFFTMLIALLTALITGVGAFKQSSSEPATVINNYYYTVPNPLSQQKRNELHRLQNRSSTPRGSNSTPSKTKKPRRK
jgi:hypothetical protein